MYLRWQAWSERRSTGLADHRSIQQRIAEIDSRVFSTEPSVLADLNMFSAGRYAGPHHRAIIRCLMGLTGVRVIDAGCKNAQVGLELLALTQVAQYIGIENDPAEAAIGLRRLEACGWCRRRYYIIVGNVFEVCAQREIDAEVVLLTWSPMIEAGRFAQECLAKFRTWRQWLVEYTPRAYAIRRRLTGKPLKPFYYTYRRSEMHLLGSRLGTVTPLFTPPAFVGSQLLLVSRLPQ